MNEPDQQLVSVQSVIGDGYVPNIADLTYVIDAVNKNPTEASIRIAGFVAEAVASRVFPPKLAVEKLEYGLARAMSLLERSRNASEVGGLPFASRMPEVIIEIQKAQEIAQGRAASASASVPGTTAGIMKVFRRGLRNGFTPPASYG